MELGTIIIILTIVIILSIILGFVNKMVRWILPIVYLVLLIVGTVIIYNDAADLRDNFLEKEKLFVLEIDGMTSAAFTVTGKNPAEIVEELSTIKKQYEDSSYYKVLLFTWESFENLQEVEFNGEKLSRPEIKQILESDNPRQLLSEKSGLPIEAVNQAYATDDMVKGDLFGNMAATAAGEESIIMAIKDGRVKVIPETISFKLIKILPDSTVEKLVPESV